MNIRPIRTEEDYEAACRRIDEIFQPEPGTPEDDELEILVTLVDVYEENRFPIEMPDPIEAIAVQMEHLGVSRKDLMDHLDKSSGRISDMLNRRRALTLADIRTLAGVLHIPFAVLAQEYRLDGPTGKEVRGSSGGAAPW